MLSNTVRMHIFMLRHVYQLMPTDCLMSSAEGNKKNNSPNSVLLAVWLNQQRYFSSPLESLDLFFIGVAVSINNFAERCFSKKPQPFLLCFITLSSHQVLLSIFHPQDRKETRKNFLSPKLATILFYHHDMPKTTIHLPP